MGIGGERGPVSSVWTKHLTWGLVGGFLLFFAGWPAVANGQVRLRFEPQVVRVAVGETARISVVAENIPASGLACFQMTLRFNPALVRVANPNERFRSAGIPPFSPLGNNPLCAAARGSALCADPPWALTATGRLPVGADRLNEGAGTVTIAYGTQGTSTLPVGEGVLALVDVIGQKRGQTAFKVEDFLLCDNSEPPRIVKRTVVRGGRVQIRP